MISVPREPTIPAKVTRGWLVLVKLSRWLWPLPWTLFGLSIGMMGLVAGGRICWYRGAIGCFGPWMERCLRWAPISQGASAMTLGHVILARSEAELVRAFDHEWVHVQQYTRWGPFLVPAYFAASLWAWLAGHHPYWDNPFEKEAYAVSLTRTSFRK
jgi:hypothetical protein